MFKSTRWVSSALVVSAALCLTYCGKSVTPPSHSNLTEGEAQQDLDLRLAKTQQLRSQVKSVLVSIKPIQSMMHDLGKDIDHKMEQQPGEALAYVLEKLRVSLHDSLSGLIKLNLDGSWTLDRPSPHPESPGHAGCDSSRVHLKGLRTGDGEAVTISLSQCEATEFEDLAVLHLHNSGNKELTLLQSCELRIDLNNVNDFRCNQVSLNSSKAVIDIQHFDYHSDTNGTHASLHAAVNGLDNSPLGTADLKLEPDHPIQIRVCIQGELCGT
jgi:hypothetical protein